MNSLPSGRPGGLPPVVPPRSRRARPTGVRGRRAGWRTDGWGPPRRGRRRDLAEGRRKPARHCGPPAGLGTATAAVAREAATARQVPPTATASPSRGVDHGPTGERPTPRSPRRWPPARRCARPPPAPPRRRPARPPPVVHGSWGTMSTPRWCWPGAPPDAWAAPPSRLSRSGACRLLSRVLDAARPGPAPRRGRAGRAGSRLLPRRCLAHDRGAARRRPGRGGRGRGLGSGAGRGTAAGWRVLAADLPFLDARPVLVTGEAGGPAMRRTRPCCVDDDGPAAVAVLGLATGPLRRPPRLPSAIRPGGRCVIWSAGLRVEPRNRRRRPTAPPAWFDCDTEEDIRRAEEWAGDDELR